eukprot:gnl/Chilomastix_cuspidata/7933.p4 GENE.gnl/Chilomastix_cuspidata/7933~~gnl/Chilomastix_cuspidata/7933.p4  ORF type:complete len:127 (-),score=13.73 gnl/Chilomastix_cuspidata/7933:759-1139(-)
MLRSFVYAGRQHCVSMLRRFAPELIPSGATLGAVLGSYLPVARLVLVPGGALSPFFVDRQRLAAFCLLEAANRWAQSAAMGWVIGRAPIAAAKLTALRRLRTPCGRFGPRAACVERARRREARWPV